MLKGRMLEGQKEKPEPAKRASPVERVTVKDFFVKAFNHTSLCIPYAAVVDSLHL